MNKLLVVFTTYVFFLPVLQASENAGKTIMAKGTVNAEMNQNIRELTRRSPIFTEDLVKTAINSATQLRMIDGGLLSIQQQSQLAINQYEFNQETHHGNVSMSLLKGGLRTITGSLNKASGNYTMQTPVASIGVRGTHYEAELLDGDLYLATWEGIIDIDVLAGTENQQFSLGPELPHKFAIVRVDGSVEFLLTVPAVFSEGHSHDLAENTAMTVRTDDILPTSDSLFIGDEIYYASALENKGAQTFFGNELQVSTLGLEPEISRSGEILFSELEQSSVVSSSGEISDLAISMNINFDTARVSNGQISFNDNGGEWFAAMDGIIEQGELDLSINFASHNNALASGEINGYLINQGHGVLGSFTLAELLNPEVNAGGSFLLNSHE